MKDAELRGQMLKVFYDRRHNAQGWVPTSDMEFSSEEMVDRQTIGTVGQQLADAGLIRWKPLVGSQEGFVIAMAQITGLGVDVVESSARSPINIVLPDSNPTQQPHSPPPKEPSLIQAHSEEQKQEPEIFTLKPSVYGVGVDLKALYQRMVKRFRNT